MNSEKTRTMNATCVIPLTDHNVEMLKRMQVNFPKPEGAKYIAFLEDGDACFLESIGTREFGAPMIPQFAMITYHENVMIEITE